MQILAFCGHKNTSQKLDEVIGQGSHKQTTQRVASRLVRCSFMRKQKDVVPTRVILQAEQ